MVLVFESSSTVAAIVEMFLTERYVGEVLASGTPLGKIKRKKLSYGQELTISVN